MNYLKPLGRFAQPGNVPVKIEKPEAMDILGVKNGVIYTYAEYYQPLPGDDAGDHNIFHPVPYENATHGLVWNWMDLFEFVKKARGTDLWRGTDFFTAWKKIEREYWERYKRYRYGRLGYYRFVPADVIPVSSLTPVDPDQRYELYETMNGFVYLEYVFTPPPDAAPTVPAVKPQSPKCSPKKVTKKK